MNKIPYLLALLFTASLLFFYYSRDNENNDNGNPPGIGNPTPTTDPGVLIGEIDGEPIRWATRNVNTPGTFAANPQSAGRLFQWGTYNGVVHHWDNVTPYVPEGFNISRRRVAWTAANDPCPTGWRVPTIAELIALRNVGYSEWTELGGVNGRFFGTAPNRIFLPASGWRSGTGGGLRSVGTGGDFWSSTALGSEYARHLRFGSGSVGTDGWHWRSVVNSVRCVAE